MESQEQLRQTVAALKAYDEKHEDIGITPEFSGYSAYTDKLAVEAAGGNAPRPDDGQQHHRRRGTARARVLAPLDQYVPDPLDLSDYLPSTVESITINDQLFGVPNDAIAVSIVIDPAVFEELDMGMPPDMWTWEDMARTAIEIGEKKGRGFWGIEDGGSSYIFFDMFLRSRGKFFVTPEREWGFEKQDLVDYWNYWKNLRDEGGVPPGDIQALANDDDPSTYGIVANRTAMIMSLTDSYMGIQSLVPRQLELHYVPNGFADGEMKQNHYVYTGNAMALWSETEHSDTVVDIVRFMHFDPEGSEIFYNGSGMVPASNEARAQLAETGSDAEKAVVAYIESIGADSATPRPRGVPGLSSAMRRMNQAIAFGQLGVEEAADQLIAEATPNLK